MTTSNEPARPELEGVGPKLRRRLGRWNELSRCRLLSCVCEPYWKRPAALAMQSTWEWKRIGNFGSLRERDRFVAWMQGQITDGIAEEIDAPADAGERWFRHTPTGSLWRLVSDENPYGPGFWPANENDKAE